MIRIRCWFNWAKNIILDIFDRILTKIQYVMKILQHENESWSEATLR